jgi:5'-methylthioadenosine phosphorylase
MTRFGEVEVTAGRLAGVEVLHVSRHLPGHARVSNHVTHRANMPALAAREVDACWR